MTQRTGSAGESATEEEPVAQSIPAVEIMFPEGLVGLPGLMHHKLNVVPDSVLYEMVSSDDPTIGFIAAAADNIVPGTTDRLRERGLVSDKEWVLAILAVHGDPPAVTANIDMEKATARQLVLEDPEFPLRAPVTGPA